ncbi:LysR family hydrogen peroxide-inducible transcriptional activator [Azospirillum fermentarium]|uniref:LysR substrate-binding domain-containing protein n=1 Tax=Azospirillum fermentarium TaxID=1233114 RepID=UPI00222649A1|nr:LysR substrate-binding domain-containing protein [Azospirillum fermentarium]MCW2246163.1 LysR family hydrogen peroxide-inducible transcriptional activator [Azospirillum fermentarium]
MIDAVTLRQLRYLVAVADTLHFGRAASACHVSQPSLSAQIQQLEDALGVALVERTQRRVLLTPAGREVVARARRILGEVSDLAAFARGAGAPLSGEVRLGVIPTLAPYYLPGVLPCLRAEHPDLKLLLREDLTGRLLDMLRAGRLDALILALPVDDPGLESAPLFDEPFHVALPAGHPLAAHESLSEDALQGERLLLLEEGHCFRDQALAVCGFDARGGDRDGFAGTSLNTLCEMVAGRIGITLLPALAAARAPAGVETRPFTAPAPSRRMGLAWRRGSPRDGELRLLGDCLRAHAPPGVTPAG